MIALKKITLMYSVSVNTDVVIYEQILGISDIQSIDRRLY